MRKTIAIGLIASVISTPVLAGSWVSAGSDEDPFSGGKLIYFGFNEASNTALIICDTKEKSLTIRIIPGYPSSPEALDFTPVMAIAVDGEVIISDLEGSTGTVGDGKLSVDAKLTEGDVSKFLDAFGKAKKQVAVKDGVSTKPFVANARGSAKAASAMAGCR